MQFKLLVVPLVLIALAELHEHGEKDTGVAAQLGARLVCHLFQDFPLPCGLEDGQIVLPLVVGNLTGHRHPPEEQLQHLIVDGIDLISQFV